MPAGSKLDAGLHCQQRWALAFRHTLQASSYVPYDTAMRDYLKDHTVRKEDCFDLGVATHKAFCELVNSGQLLNRQTHVMKEIVQLQKYASKMYVQKGQDPTLGEFSPEESLE